MILLIDNYDSFTFNLVHFLGDLGARCDVWRNDALSVEAALAKAPEAIVFPAHWDPKLRIPRGQVVAAASIVSPKY